MNFKKLIGCVSFCFVFLLLGFQLEASSRFPNPNQKYRIVMAVPTGGDSVYIFEDNRLNTYGVYVDDSRLRNREGYPGDMVSGNWIRRHMTDYADGIWDIVILDEIMYPVLNGDSDLLLDFSKERLGIIRNTVYARKGYIFQTDKYRNYFSRKPWYRGITKSSNILSEEEQVFVAIVKKYENRK